MPVYGVHIQLIVSTTIDVEADSPEQAAETFTDHPDMPGSLTYGAFGGGASVDEAGEWEPVSIVDDKQREVWTTRSN